MIVVNITFHADTRLMEITSVSTGDKVIGTTGDDLATRLQFTFDDPEETLVAYGKRVDFGIELIDSDLASYRPYLILDANDGVDIPSSIMSNVKCGKLPIQLVFGYENGNTGFREDFYSLNILNLAVNKSIDAIAESPVERYPQVNDAIWDVRYDSSSATFTFIQIDGSVIEVGLKDLSEEHFEVATRTDLVTLTEAERGDTATALDTGVWYKLYGSYDNLSKWYPMSGNATINGQQTGTPVFYAPNDSGTANQIIKSNGINNAPTWMTSCKVFVVPITGGTDRQVSHGLGTNQIDCTFYDSNNNRIEPAYTIDNTNITISMNTTETVRMVVTTLPVWSVTE